MKALLALALTGCVTTLGLTRPDAVSLPLFIAATAGDLASVGVIAAEAEGFTTGASIGTALAVTAVDVAVGCLLGSCSSLKL